MSVKIKAVIFDLDGTLIDAYQAVEASMNYALKTGGFPEVSALTIKRSVGWGDKHLVEKFVGKTHAGRVLDIYRKHHRHSLKQGVRFLPGAKKLLDELHKEGYILAVATNRPQRFTRIILKVLNIHGHFDHVLCADKIKRPKPYPDILKLILKKFKLKSTQALYVGDMTIDVQTGHRAKVKTAAVLTGSCSHEEISALNPFAIVPRISHIKSVIKTIEMQS